MLQRTAWISPRTFSRFTGLMATRERSAARSSRAAKVTEFFAVRPAGRIAMEACGGAHHWGRTLGPLGHQIELLPTHQVRPFISGNKDDAADARGIWLAAQHGDIRRVAVKSSEQQAMLSLHRMRTHWVSVRTATVNALRGLLYEFGVTLPPRSALRPATTGPATRRDQRRCAGGHGAAGGRSTARPCGHRTARPSDGRGDQPDAQRARKAPVVCVTPPGIGVLGATALAATLGDGTSWRNGREFACCLGLAPGHRGTGGKVRIGEHQQAWERLPANPADQRRPRFGQRASTRPRGSWRCWGGAPSTWWWSPSRTSWHASRGLWWRMGGPTKRAGKASAPPAASAGAA
jgi:transposase